MIGYIPRLFITYKLLFTYTKKSIFSLFSTFFRKTIFLFTGSCYNILVSQTKGQYHDEQRRQSKFGIDDRQHL